MPKNNLPFEDLSQTTARGVEQNMEKVRGAMDSYFSFIQNIWGNNIQNIWGSNDLMEKMKTYTEKNISAYTECVGKLSQAKDFQDVFRIQTEYMQTQLNSLTEQARSLGEAYNKAATDATKPFRTT
jgi:hypothetical protein